MYYDKKIRYLNYYENGIKLQNAGYVKFQVRDHVCQMVLSIKGPRLMGSGEAKVYLLSEDAGGKERNSSVLEEQRGASEGKLLGTVCIRNGQGYCAVRMDADEMGDAGLRYDEVTGIKIVLREYQYLESRWIVINHMPWAKPILREVFVTEKTDDEKQIEMKPEMTPVSEGTREESLSEEHLPEESLSEERLPEESLSEERLPEEYLTEEWEEVSELRPDKWEQLRETFPIVHPIREEEEYLKIEPKDFVIFSGKYQELVHNSFLLHGYYNYKHLILGKKEKDEKTIYYLGVPGTFHEREKKVAVMFGFEAFDGKREPAETGDFGYYLMRVEL